MQAERDREHNKRKKPPLSFAFHVVYIHILPARSERDDNMQIGHTQIDSSVRLAALRNGVGGRSPSKQKQCGRDELQSGYKRVALTAKKCCRSVAAIISEMVDLWLHGEGAMYGAKKMQMAENRIAWDLAVKLAHTHTWLCWHSSSTNNCAVFSAIVVEFSCPVLVKKEGIKC